MTFSTTEPEYEEEISFLPFLATIWRYRQVIVSSVVTIMTLFVIVVVALYLISSPDRFGSIGFRLLFEGTQEGQYPNGTRFSTAEIVDTPVLSEVYTANNLQRYLTYEDFKNAVFVLQSNPALNMLTYEYQAKLADTKLTPADRARLENEFRTKSEGLKDPLYSINYRRGESISLMPTATVAKVLGDTLAAWARQVQNTRGAFEYRIPVYSTNLIRRDFVSALDYAIAVDVLRTKALRIMIALQDIERLPGAQVVRTGKEQISLGEIRANLEDLLRFKLQPLMGVIRAYGLSKNPQALALYFDNQLFQVRLDHQNAQRRVSAVEDSLRAYLQQGGTAVASRDTGSQPQNQGQNRGAAALESPALIPQFGESFLDRLMALSTQNSDVKYRQQLTDRVITEKLAMAGFDGEAAYYEDLIRSLRANASAANTSKPALAAEVAVSADAALNELLEMLGQIQAIYKEISAHNLNPSTLLYSVTTPFSTTTVRSLTFARISMYGAFTFLLSMLIVSVVCLLHSFLAGSPSLREPAVEQSADIHPASQIGDLPRAVEIQRRGR